VTAESSHKYWTARRDWSRIKTNQCKGTSKNDVTRFKARIYPSIPTFCHISSQLIEQCFTSPPTQYTHHPLKRTSQSKNRLLPYSSSSSTTPDRWSAAPLDVILQHLQWHSPVSQTTQPCDCNSLDRHYYPLALDTKNIFALKTNNTRVCKFPVPLYNHDVIYGRPLNIADRNWKICCTAADRERDRHTDRQTDR